MDEQQFIFDFAFLVRKGFGPISIIILIITGGIYLIIWLFKGGEPTGYITKHEPSQELKMVDLYRYSIFSMMESKSLDELYIKLDKLGISKELKEILSGLAAISLNIIMEEKDYDLDAIKENLKENEVPEEIANDLSKVIREIIEELIKAKK